MTSPHSTVPGYSLAERDRRWALADAFMSRLHLDALLVYGEHEDAGASAFCFDTWFTNDRAGSTVLKPKGAEPIAFVPMPLYLLDRLEAGRRGDDIWIAAPDVRIGRDAAMLVAELKNRGLAGARIGVVGLDPYIPWHPEGVIPHGLMQKLTAGAPEAEFVSVGTDFGLLTLELSPEEVEVLRHAARIGDAMVDAMVATTRPGVSEAAVYAAGVAAALAHGTVVPGMHLWSGAEWAASGPPAWSYRPKAPRTIENGDFLMSEIFCNFGMRASQHQLTMAVGDVHRDVERAAEIAGQCYRAGLPALRAGTRFGDVAEAMLGPVEAAGGWVRGPQLHSLNPFAALCRSPADNIRVEGMEQFPSVAEMPSVLADLVLEPGMSFAFEPSCGFGRHVVTLGGTVLVGEGSAIELNPGAARLRRAGG